MKSKISLVVFLSCCALSACGGGSAPPIGADPPPPSPPPPPPPPPGGDADLQTSVPLPDHADAYRRDLFLRINAIRADLGMGLLAQNHALDRAAQNHMDYGFDPDGTQDRIHENPSSGSAGQFTGVTPQDRCTYAGYAGLCPDPSEWGGSKVRFDAYAGLVVLTQGAREAGLSERGDLFMIPLMPFIQLGYPSGRNPQRQASGFAVFTPLWGAFHVQAREGETLTVQTFEVRDASGAVIEGRLLTNDTDPLHRVPAHAAMFVPAAPSGFSCGSAYSVRFEGLRDGQRLSVNRSGLLQAPFCE